MLELTIEINMGREDKVTKKVPHDISTYQLSWILGGSFLLPPHTLNFFSNDKLIDTSPSAKIKLIDFFSDEEYQTGKVIKISSKHDNNKATLTVFSNRNKNVFENAKLLTLFAFENPHFAKLPLEVLEEILVLFSLKMNRAQAYCLFSSCLTVKIRELEAKIKEDRDSISITACGLFKSTPLITDSDETQELAMEI